jgi:hypothetical protein
VPTAHSLLQLRIAKRRTTITAPRSNAAETYTPVIAD